MKDEIKNIKHAITLLQKALAQLEGRLDVDGVNDRYLGRMVPPSYEESFRWHRAHRYVFYFEEWFNHYTSNGWKVGRNPMKSWETTMAQWQSRYLKKNPVREKTRFDAVGRPIEDTPPSLISRMK